MRHDLVLAFPFICAGTGQVDISGFFAPPSIDLTPMGRVLPQMQRYFAELMMEESSRPDFSRVILNPNPHVALCLAALIVGVTDNVKIGLVPIGSGKPASWLGLDHSWIETPMASLPQPGGDADDVVLDFTCQLESQRESLASFDRDIRIVPCNVGDFTPQQLAHEEGRRHLQKVVFDGLQAAGTGKLLVNPHINGTIAVFTSWIMRAVLGTWPRHLRLARIPLKQVVHNYKYADDLPTDNGQKVEIIDVQKGHEWSQKWLRGNQEPEFSVTISGNFPADCLLELQSRLDIWGVRIRVQ